MVQMQPACEEQLRRCPQRSRQGLSVTYFKRQHGKPPAHSMCIYTAVQAHAFRLHNSTTTESWCHSQAPLR